MFAYFKHIFKLDLVELQFKQSHKNVNLHQQEIYQWEMVTL